MAKPGITINAPALLSSDDESIDIEGGPAFGQVNFRLAGGLALDWWSQRARRAQTVLNRNGLIQVDSPKPFDYTLAAPILTGTTPPVVDPTRSGAAFILNGVADGTLQDSPTAGSMLIGSPQTESWYAARWSQFNGASVLGAESIPLWLLGAANVYIRIGLNSALSPTHNFIIVDNGSGVPQWDDLGADAAIGGALCPNGAPYTSAVYFDLTDGALVVEFQDQEVARYTTASPFWGNVPTTALQLFALNDGVSGLSPTVFGGFGMIKGPLL